MIVSHGLGDGPLVAYGLGVAERILSALYAYLSGAWRASTAVYAFHDGAWRVTRTAHVLTADGWRRLV